MASLLGIIHPAGIMHGVVSSRYDLVRVWYALVSLPLFLFVLWPFGRLRGQSLT
jgi:hypothetical protein